MMLEDAEVPTLTDVLAPEHCHTSKLYAGSCWCSWYCGEGASSAGAGAHARADAADSSDAGRGRNACCTDPNIHMTADSSAWLYNASFKHVHEGLLVLQ